MSTLKAALLVTPQEIFTSSATQGTDLGAEAITGDGRRFRYVLAGGSSLVIGKLQSAPAETTGWQDLDIAAASSGATSITTTSTVTVGANGWSNGFMTVTNGTGAGYNYQIKSNPAASGAAITFSLADPLQTNLANTVDIDIIASPYSGVVLWATSQVAMALGVCVFPITNAQFGWIQTGGVASVLVDAGNLTVGQLAVASDDTDGAVGPFESDALAFPVVGTAVTGASSGEYGFVNLNMN